MMLKPDKLEFRGMEPGGTPSLHLVYEMADMTTTQRLAMERMLAALLEHKATGRSE